MIAARGQHRPSWDQEKDEELIHWLGLENFCRTVAGALKTKCGGEGGGVWSLAATIRTAGCLGTRGIRYSTLTGSGRRKTGETGAN